MVFDRQPDVSAAEAEAARARPAPAPAPDLAGQLMQLQALGGNQMVGRLLNSMSDGPSADPGAAKTGLIAQLNGLLAELPADGVRLTPEELAGLNGHLAQLSTLLGRPLPPVVASAPVGVLPGLVPVATPTIAEMLTAIGAAIAGLSLAEALLIIAAIAAIILLILLLFRSAVRRPAPAPPAEVDEKPDEKGKPKPEDGPRPPGPVPVPVPPGPRAIFGPVRAANTPAKMPDRIPDAGVVDVAVQIINWTPALGPIRITVDNAPAGGAADFGGSPETVVNGPSAVLPVHGSRQSPIASGTPLKLTARLGGTTPIGSSAGFAVAAIMQDMATAFGRIVNDASAGMVVSMSWQSDGASIRSVNEIEFEEQLLLVSETGSLAGHGLGDHGGLLVADIMPQNDNHLSPHADVTKGPGSQVIQQVFGFMDNRTGSIGMVVRNSGFSISRVIEADPSRPGKLHMIMTKVGRAGAVGAFASGAGAGAAMAIIPLN